jgi:hypothetical protein
MMQMHYFHQTCPLAHREGGLPLFTSCREEFFSETQGTRGPDLYFRAVATTIPT